MADESERKTRKSRIDPKLDAAGWRLRGKDARRAEAKKRATAPWRRTAHRDGADDGRTALAPTPRGDDDLAQRGSPRGEAARMASTLAARCRALVAAALVGGCATGAGGTPTAPPTAQMGSPAASAAIRGYLPAPTTATEFVLFDPGLGPHPPATHNAFAPAAAATLRQLFPTYLSSATQCSTATTDLADARAKGQVVPSVLGVIEGSFVTPRAPESLYQISVGECGASHADNWGSQIFAVTLAGRVIESARADGGSAIDGVFDLDGDGREELLVTQGFTNQGVTTEAARLVAFRGRLLVTIQDFGSVYESNCAGTFQPLQESYSVIHATPRAGAALGFRIEKFSRPCPAQ